MKLCKDCSYLDYTYLGSLTLCKRPIGIHCITGEVETLDMYCSFERKYGWLEARFYEHVVKRLDILRRNNVRLF